MSVTYAYYRFSRFLRARSFDPKAAFRQYETTAAWRRKTKINELYDETDLTGFETIRRLMPQWIGRRDLNGVPICVYAVSEIPVKSVLSVQQKDPNLSSVFLSAEYMTEFVQPLCTQLSPNGVQIARSVNIVDLSGVGLGLFWNLRKLLQTSSNMATAHYPESVERIFVIGAPSFFPTIWGFIQRWFEPATTSKIAVLSNAEMTSTLAQYIDLDDLPRRYGGHINWEFGDHPMFDNETEDILGKPLAKSLSGPVRLIDGSQEIIAVGSENGNLRGNVLGRLKANGRTRADSKLD
ncbi:MAG: hypothetical protein Q9160_001021 [Pyrenula sp. 1 TL-2023]